MRLNVRSNFIYLKLDRLFLWKHFKWRNNIKKQIILLLLYKVRGF